MRRKYMLGIVVLISSLIAGCTSLPEERSSMAWGTANADAARIAYNTAIEFLDKGRQADAEQVAAEALLKHPQSQRIHLLCAVLANSRYNSGEAGRLLFKLYDMDPDSLCGRVAHLVVGEEVGLKEAFEELKKLIDAYPDDVLLRWFYAMETTHQKLFAEEGARQFDALLQVWEVGPVMLHHTYASLLTSQLNVPEKALAHEQLAAELEPNAMTYQGLAFTLFSMKRYEDANEVFEKLVEMTPENAVIWFQWGNCLAYLGNYAAAAEKFEQSAKEEGMVEEVSMVCWGRCLELLGHPEEGVEKYEQARRRSGPGGLADSYLTIARLYGYGCPVDFEAAIDSAVDRSSGSAVANLRVELQNVSSTDNPLAPAPMVVLQNHLLSLGDQNDAEAQYSLAMLYRHGIGITKDETVSKQWLELAAKNGHIIALSMLNPPLQSIGPVELDVDENFQGIWISGNSLAVYEIAQNEELFAIRGYSSQSGREMIVGDVSWSDPVLRFTSYMPTTGKQVVRECKLINDRSMVCTTLPAGNTLSFKKVQVVP